jgi:site-specific recombinase XerD
MSKKRRTKGSGSLFKKSNGNYCWQYRDTVTGKLKTKTLKDSEGKNVTDKKLAESFLKEEIKKYQELLNANTREKTLLELAENRKFIKKSRLKIDKVWELYLKNPSRPDSSDGTLGNYKRMWNKFANWLTVHYPSVSNLAEITEDIAKEYAQELWSSKLSANTYNYHIQALKLICKILKTEMGFDINPFDCITRKAEIKQTRKELTEKEVINLLDSFKNKKLSLPNKEEMRIMFNIGTWTGLRLIDCATMEWASIDFERNLINCMPEKTKRKTQKKVAIPIHPRLRDELETALSWKSDNFVLPKVAERYRRNATGIKQDVIKVFQFAGFDTTQNVKNGVQRKRKANIYGFHSFRHSFVSFCAKAGIPLPVVQSIVGHGNPAITRHYIHIGENSVKQAINALPMASYSTLGFDKEKKTRIIKLLDKTTSKQLDEILKLLNKE